MSVGYSIHWTSNALVELQSTYDYLETYWSKKSAQRLSQHIEKISTLIEENPKLYPVAENPILRQATIKSHNILFYYIDEDSRMIYIVSFWDTHQNPDKQP